MRAPAALRDSDLAACYAQYVPHAVGARLFFEVSPVVSPEAAQNRASDEVRRPRQKQITAAQTACPGRRRRPSGPSESEDLDTAEHGAMLARGGRRLAKSHSE
jgi:hypothetical protein